MSCISIDNFKCDNFFKQCGLSTDIFCQRLWPWHMKFWSSQLRNFIDILESWRIALLWLLSIGPSAKYLRGFWELSWALGSARDHSMYVPAQLEMALQCDAISHWLGTYTEWSLLWDPVTGEVGESYLYMFVLMTKSAWLVNNWLWQGTIIFDRGVYHVYGENWEIAWLLVCPVSKSIIGRVPGPQWCLS